MTAEDTVVLDVRPDLAAGREPLSKIMQAARELPAGRALVVLAPFVPAPLFGVLGKMGFTHEEAPLEGGGCRVTFRRAAEGGADA